MLLSLEQFDGLQRGLSKGCCVGYTVVPGFRVLGFRALPGFRAQKAGDRAWSVHKMLFGFRAPILALFVK